MPRDLQRLLGQWDTTAAATVTLRSITREQRFSATAIE